MFHSKVAFLLVLATIASAELNTLNETFVSDTEVAAHYQFPWHATLFVISRNGPAFAACGALISTKHVVTVGHFAALGIQHGNALAVFAKRFNHGPRYPVRNIVVHPKYVQSRNARFNIGVLSLRQPIRPSRTIRPIAIAATAPAERQTVSLVGFGEHCEYHSFDKRFYEKN